MKAMSTMNQLGRTFNLVSYFLVMLLHAQDAPVTGVTFRRNPDAFGKKTAMAGCAAEDGVAWINSMNAPNAAVFFHETAELAFSEEAVRFQLAVASGLSAWHCQDCG